MFTYDEKYKFTETWFDPMIPNWEKTFDNYLKNQPNINDVLEVGCYEGRATIFLCDVILKDGTNYDIVDTFGGSLEESGMQNTANRLNESEDPIYDNFSHNISFHKDRINFGINRGYSQHVLPTLVEKGKQYDFIYIDASHKADDTFVDAYFAHKMLRKGGLIIFDDFGWKDPNRPHPVNSPELGIRQFFTMYEQEYSLFFDGYQIGAIKIK